MLLVTGWKDFCLGITACVGRGDTIDELQSLLFILTILRDVILYVGFLLALLQNTPFRWRDEEMNYFVCTCMYVNHEV